MKETERMTLKDEVKRLLDEGKRSGNREFQLLFKFYGKEKIAGMAREFLKKKNDQKTT